MIPAIYEAEIELHEFSSSGVKKRLVMYGQLYFQVFFQYLWLINKIQTKVIFDCVASYL
jgi:hypothetical protein